MRQLVRRHASRLHACAHRILGDASLAEEVVQDVFTTMVRAGAGFRSDANVGTWLYVIAINRCRTMRRRSAFAAADRSVPVDSRTPDSSPDPHAELELSERRTRLARAVERLPLEMREVIALRFAGGHSYDELAELLGCPVGTVASRLHRALRRLGDELKSEGLTPESI